MVTTGTVRSWNDEEGWGVIDSPVTPGGCWVSFADVRLQAPGFLSLSPGQEVLFEWEAADQDGFCFRARAATPAGDGIRAVIPPPANPMNNPGGTYRSRLSIRFDE
ncbi:MULTISPECIES: cold-shock protein [Arthrobacter]|uniref:cold-shock protein n=1 Tax=Arthrobacter TaxID=1663 RepID=UPI0028F721D5|nr:hypothetical protein [Arthrobacter sp. lap29]